MIRLLTHLAMPSVLLLTLFANSMMAASPTARATVTQTRGMVVVYVHDLHRLRLAHESLRATVQLAGSDVQHDVDLSAAFQSPAILIRKSSDTSIDTVTVTLLTGDQVLWRGTVPAGEPVEPQAIEQLSDDIALIELADGQNSAPTIRQPNIGALPELQLQGSASRSSDLDAIHFRVISDHNFPLISSRLQCAAGRQTAHPDDATRRSIYLPYKSQMYDVDRWLPTRVMHYLIEVPLDPAWLEGEGDVTIDLAADDIKIHLPDTRWPTDDPDAEWVTGNSMGGLGQNRQSFDVDDGRFVYFSGSMRAQIIRFNIAEARFEPVPIDINKELQRFFPTADELPEELRGKRLLWDPYYMINVSPTHIFLRPVHYRYNGDSITLNAVFSFPLEHWHNAEKFRAGMRLVAGSWPTSINALYDNWPTKDQPVRMFGNAFFHDGSFYVPPYRGTTTGGPWRFQMNADGSAANVSIITKETITAARNAAQPTLPKEPTFYWKDYGLLTGTRDQFRETILGKTDSKTPGNITITYDPIATMRSNPQHFKRILPTEGSPSMAASYVSTEIPGQPQHMLGTGEYGYLFAEYDFTDLESGYIKKQYLQDATGSSNNFRPIRTVGPYAGIWHKQNNNLSLILTGYGGIESLNYIVDGKVDHSPTHNRISTSRKQLNDIPKQAPILWHRFPLWGIDGRTYHTGNHSAHRNGNAYSNGLQAFDPAGKQEAVILSKLSRGSHTRYLRARVIHEPDGSARQQFILAASPSDTAYLADLLAEEKPTHEHGRTILYDVAPGEPPRDLYSYSVPQSPKHKAQSETIDQIFSRDRRYLITLQQDCMFVFDMENARYTDAKKLSATVLFGDRPTRRFHRAPNDEIFFATFDPDGKAVTFYTLDTTPAGKLSIAPHFTLHTNNAGRLQHLQGGSYCFLTDPKMDGSYDLVIGPNWRSPRADTRVIRDYFSPR